jgi:hypothetical protein
MGVSFRDEAFESLALEMGTSRFAGCFTASGFYLIPI